MTLSYALEKYWTGIHSLAADGSMKSRLTNAWLSVMRVNPEEDIPDQDIRREHAHLMRELTKVQDGPGEGTFQKTLNRMTDEQAEQYGAQLVSLCYRLAELE